MNRFACQPNQQNGGSLLELMAVVLIIAIFAASAMPLLQEQAAARQIDSVARQFIAHAQFARGQALTLGITVQIAPLNGGLWDEGWHVSIPCQTGLPGMTCQHRPWLTQKSVAPVFFKGGGKQFMDPHLATRGIAFNAAGAAKTAHGGFVANRLILGHERHPNLERQLILGSGGRWRICDPQRDAKACA